MLYKRIIEHQFVLKIILSYSKLRIVVECRNYLKRSITINNKIVSAINRRNKVDYKMSSKSPTTNNGGTHFAITVTIQAQIVKVYCRFDRDKHGF